MNTVLQVGMSALIVLLYGYVIGTMLWLIIVAPGLYRRQRDLVRRVEQLERRADGDQSEHRTI